MGGGGGEKEEEEEERAYLFQLPASSLTMRNSLNCLLLILSSPFFRREKEALFAIIIRYICPRRVHS